MANSNKKAPVLSSEMADLKQQIQGKIRKEEDLQEQVHRKSRFIDYFASAYSSLAGVISSVPDMISQIPIAGFVVKMVAIIPGAIATLTDSKKSIAEKAIAMAILLSVVALSIAAFAVVAVVAGASAAVVAAAAVKAAIIGTTIASFMAALEIYKLVGFSIEKHRARNALDDKKVFEEALSKLSMPEGSDNKFDAELEIRAVELTRKKTSPGLSQEEQEKIEKELAFVTNELTKRGITTIGANEDSAAYKLQKLYDKRDAKLLASAAMVAAIKSAPEGTDLTTTFDKMRKLQEKLVKIDDDIEDIIQPLEKVTRRNMIAGENVAQSVTTLSMALAGLALSVAGYLIAATGAGAVVAPIFGWFGFGMACMSLGTGLAFRDAEHSDVMEKEIKLENQKDDLLDEVLDCYEKNQTTISSRPGIMPVATTSSVQSTTPGSVPSTSIILGGLGHKPAEQQSAILASTPVAASNPVPVVIKAATEPKPEDVISSSTPSLT